jgi:DNA phosphorothioation-dependent restriction protein DptH
MYSVRSSRISATIQLEELRQALKQSYDDVGWVDSTASETENTKLPRVLRHSRCKDKAERWSPSATARACRLRVFDGAGERPSLLDSNQPTIIRVHGTTNGILQNAFSSFVLYSLYKDMFRRGVQSQLTHAIVFDEAHRAARLKLIPQFAKECRKFGLSLTLASQEAKDFAASLYSAVGSYLVLRVTEADARVLSRMTGTSADEKQIADQLKSLGRYTAVFFTEGQARPARAHLTP